MSNTRKTLQALGKGFEKIKDLTCSPWSWACGEYDKKGSSCFDSAVKNANSSTVFVAAAGGLAVDAVCAVPKCLCRSPAACVCSAVTVPVGVAAGVTLGTLSLFALAGAGTYDLATGKCGPAHQEMDERPRLKA